MLRISERGLELRHLGLHLVDSVPTDKCCENNTLRCLLGVTIGNWKGLVEGVVWSQRLSGRNYSSPLSNGQELLFGKNKTLNI